MIGNSLKSIYSRITSIQPAIDAMAEIGINIKTSGGEMRNVSSIIDDLGGKWNTLSAEQQQNLGLQIAGRFQLSRFLILMNQYDQALDSTNTALDSAGSGYRENQEYLKSFEAQINMVKNAWTEAVLAMRDSGLGDGLVIGLSTGLEFFKILTSIIDRFGVFPTLIGAGVAVFTLFNNNMRTSAMETGRFVTTLLTSPPAFARFQASMVGSAAAGRGFATAMGLANASVTVLGRGLTFLAGIALPVAGLMAVGAAVSYVIGKLVEGSKAQKEFEDSFKASQDASVDAITRNKVQVDELIESFESLRKKRESEDLSVEENEKYLSIQQELAEIFPSLIDYVDKKGVAHLKSSEGINAEVEAAEALLEIRQQEAVLAAKDTYKDSAKQISDIESQIREAENRLETAEKRSREGYASTSVVEKNAKEAEYIRNQITQLEILRAGAISNLSADVAGVSGSYLALMGTLDEVEIAMGRVFRELDFTDIGMKPDEIEAIRLKIDSLGAGLSQAFDSGNVDEYNKKLEELVILLESLGVDESFIDSLKNGELSFADLTETMKKNEEAARLAAQALEESGDSADGVVDSMLELGEATDETKIYMEGLEGSAYELADALDMMTGVTQQHISDSDELMWMYESLTERLEHLVEGSQSYVDATGQINGVTDELLGLFPHLSNESLHLLDVYEDLANGTYAQTSESQELGWAMERLLELHPELVGAGINRIDVIQAVIGNIAEEIEANDILRAAEHASAQGKLTADEKRVLSSAQAAKSNITNINQEIAALNKLAVAYDKYFAAAVAGMNTARAAGAIMPELDAEHNALQMHAQAGKARAQSASALASLSGITNDYNVAIGKLGQSENVLGNATTRGNKAKNEAAKASKKAADAAKKGAKATKDSTKAMEESKYVADQYARSLELLNYEIKRQQDLQSKYPNHSAKYREALEKEMELQRSKRDLLRDQSAEMSKQVSAGKIAQTGIVTTSSTTNKNLSGWGGRVTSQYKTAARPNHGGVDLAAARGTRLDSNVEGKVIRTAKDGQYGTYGNVVIVQDKSGMQHLYAHLDKIAVSVGQAVSAGMQIGNTGNTGRSTGPHLHYEVRNSSGKAVNPTSYLNAAKAGTTVSTASKDAAQAEQAVDNARSSLLKLQEEAEAAHERVMQLRVEIVKSHISEFQYYRDLQQRMIDFQNVRQKGIAKGSKELGWSIDAQIDSINEQLREYQDEWKYLNEVASSHTSTGAMLEEVKNRAVEARLEMVELKLVLQDALYSKVQNRNQGISEEIDNLQYLIDVSQEYSKSLLAGSELYQKEVRSQITSQEKQRDLIRNQINALKEAVRQHHLTKEQIREITEQVEDLTLQYWQMVNTIKDTNKQLEESIKAMGSEVGDALLNSYTNYLEEKRKAHTKSIDEEMKKEDERHKKVSDNLKKELDDFRKSVQDKIDLIDKQESEDDFNKEMDNLLRDRNKIQEEIDRLALDDSQFAKARRKALQDELDALDENISTKQHKRDIELRKESLQSELESKEEEIAKKEELEDKRHESEKERLSQMREYWELHYEDLLNDERKFSEIRQQIVSGEFEELREEFGGFLDYLVDTMPDLENTLGNTMDAVGTSIRQNMIDALREALGLLQDVKEEFDEFENPSSGAGGQYESDKHVNTDGWKKEGENWKNYRDGKAQTGWYQDKGEWYHSGQDGNMSTGWVKDKDSWYYTNKDGQMQSGWFQDDKKDWYLANESGKMATGWQMKDNKWYHLQDSGKMSTGWQNIKGKWYHMDNKGAMQTGWNQVKDKWYYMDGNGAMQTGWNQVNDKWYYMNQSGDMAKGWKQILDKWYYLDEKTGAMINDAEATINGKKHKFKPSGEWIAGFESGGYTGDFKGGKLAVLHEKELILNKGQTADMLKTFQLFDKLNGMIPQAPQLSQSGTQSGLSVESLVNIENFSGTQKEVDSLSKTLVDSLYKRGVNLR